MAALLLFVSAFVSLSCRGDQSPTGPSQPGRRVELNLEQSSVNFTLRYSEHSAGVVNAYLAELEANLPRVLADLDVTLADRIVGRLYPDRDAFQAATGFIGSGAALGRNLFGLAAIPYAPSDAVHEMAHVVTWQLSSPALSTTWLWESIAVYEAGSFVPPSSIRDLVAGRFPTLGELNDLSHRPSVYQVGYTILEFLTEEWGWHAVRQLVVSRGDLEATIGLTTAEFEARWRRFVESRYFSESSRSAARDPFANTSNGLMSVGERLPRSNFEFDRPFKLCMHCKIGRDRASIPACGPPGRTFDTALAFSSSIQASR